MIGQNRRLIGALILVAITMIGTIRIHEKRYEYDEKVSAGLTWPQKFLGGKNIWIYR